MRNQTSELDLLFGNSNNKSKPLYRLYVDDSGSEPLWQFKTSKGKVLNPLWWAHGEFSDVMTCQQVNQSQRYITFPVFYLYWIKELLHEYSIILWNAAYEEAAQNVMGVNRNSFQKGFSKLDKSCCKTADAAVKSYWKLFYD